MTPPPVHSLGVALYERLEPLQPDDEARGYVLRALAYAVALGGEPVEALIRDWDDGYSGLAHLLDPDTCPVEHLPFLAVIAGVELRADMTEVQQRALIRDQPAQFDGTPAALKAAARQALADPDNSPVALVERVDGDEDRALLITYEADTPDLAAVVRNVMAAKEVGLLLEIRVDPGWSIGQAEQEYSTRTIGDFESAFATIGDAESNLPI